MLASLLTITAISLALFYPLTSLFRKDCSLATFVLFVSLLVTATVEIADFCAQLFPENLYFWKQITIIAESCLAPACFFTVWSSPVKGNFPRFPLPRRYSFLWRYL